MSRDVSSPAELFDLTGRVAVVTGASSGLGARWAQGSGAADAHVGLAPGRSEERAAVGASIPGSLVVVGDVTLEEDRRRLVDETMQRFGTIDVLVNNAGIAASAPAMETTVDDFRSMV